jgi:ATP-dependent Clp protease ATP-binding subunit ClpA
MMTKELERRLGDAVQMAKTAKHEFVTLEHVLMALCETPSIVELLQACNADVQKVKSELKAFVKKSCPKITDDQINTYGGFDSWHPEFTLACHRLFQRSAMQIRNAGRSHISEGHLLVALFYEQESFAVHFLAKQGVSQFDIIQQLAAFDPTPGVDPTPLISAPGTEPQQNTKSALESYCQNLNEKALSGKTDPLIGRDEVLERMMQILCRKTKNNPLLIGEPGVGKTAVAEGLAQRIVQGKVPESLKNKIIYSLDLGSLLAGTKFRGDFEARLKNVIKEIKDRKNCVLFVDEIHTLVGAGATSGGSMDASNLLKPALANGEISCIGSTTHQEFRQYFEKERALNRRFQKIDLKEPTVAQTIEILNGLKKSYETHHNVYYEEDSLKAAAELSQKYIHNKLMPDKAIDVIDEAGAYANLKGFVGQVISAKEIEDTVARISQVPSSSVSADDKSLLKDIDKKLKAAIFGQDEAIDKLVSSIKLSRSGLGNDEKPIGSFLFTGPTGVGKTEICKQLAYFLGIPLVRFDMSEYMEKHTVARLVGAPPGYVGFEEGGQLTEAVTKNPYCVLLLDEMEKAHPDIFNVLLQVMDAGRLTDANGRITNFQNVIMVMTSNAGALEVARGAIGIAEVSSQGFSLEAIKKAFSPEFINRLSAIVTFANLDDQIIFKIVQKAIDELKMQLQKKLVDFSVSAEVVSFIKEKGYSKTYGARPIARTVEEHLKKPLVEELLFGRLSKGGKVSVIVKDAALTFNYK